MRRRPSVRHDDALRGVRAWHSGVADGPSSVGALAPRRTRARRRTHEARGAGSLSRASSPMNERRVAYFLAGGSGMLTWATVFIEPSGCRWLTART